MKALTLFFALAVSLALTSCSQLDQENTPLTPQLSKHSVPSNNETYPYEYLATFPEMKSVKWDETLSDDQWVVVTLDEQSREYQHIFCEVIYTDLTEPIEKESELFFAGKPENLRFAFSKPDNKYVYEVRVYVVYSANEIPVYNEIPFPYNYMQKFNPIYVNAWDTKDEVISVSASDDVIMSSQVFAQINSELGNMLVFLEKPSSKFFDIPKYGDKGVQDINLYGLSAVRTYDVE